jgi:hypothetical protein
MTNFTEMAEMAWFQVARADTRTWLIVATVAAVIAIGFAARMMRAIATKRLRSVLDIYAERQLAMNLPLERLSPQASEVAYRALRDSGLVMGVRR